MNDHQTNDLKRSLGVAIDRLEEALHATDTSLHRDASIQRFEFCFELAWKAMQKALRAEGLDCASPKGCLREAYRQGWIEEQPWLEMLADRNLTSHTYDEKLARKVYARLSGHLPALRSLAARLADE